MSGLIFTVTPMISAQRHPVRRKRRLAARELHVHHARLQQLHDRVEVDGVEVDEHLVGQHDRRVVPDAVFERARVQGVDDRGHPLRHRLGGVVERLLSDHVLLDPLGKLRADPAHDLALLRCHPVQRHAGHVTASLRSTTTVAP
jgi:hypothetical protein